MYATLCVHENVHTAATTLLKQASEATDLPRAELHSDLGNDDEKAATNRIHLHDTHAGQ
jgi:hypothetical protein